MERNYFIEPGEDPEDKKRYEDIYYQLHLMCEKKRKEENEKILLSNEKGS